MLKITIPETELWDKNKREFLYVKETTLQLEHSLVALSKWESKWCKPFLTNNEKTREELIDYIRCMTITQNVKPEVYLAITSENIDEISAYIKAPMTATWFSEDKTSKPSRETLTSELIYYWMLTLNIPVEFQKWHLNRLMTLIKICNRKNQPKKKMSREEMAALNRARRKQLNSKG